MKMTDNNEQDDHFIQAVIPIKKKKMKQAQLPFQLQSPMHSPNVVQNKKRKLSSPYIDHKSPKAIKVSDNTFNEDVINNELNDASDGSANKDSDVEIIKDVENVKENTSDEVKNVNKTTPKRTLTGQKKFERQEKLKSSSLTKFLKKTDKEEERTKEIYKHSMQEEKNKSMDKSFDVEIDLDLLSQSTSNKLEESSLTVNNSMSHNVDSDVAIISSDSDEKDEQPQSNDNMERSVETNSPKTPKTDNADQKRLTPKQQAKKLLSAKKKEERQRMKMEKEKKLEEERENRRREKEEKRRQKEEREKAEKEQKMMEKKMKEQKKQMEIEQKQKEKQAKEEERKKREEERRKKEEEKLEAERKKQKAASNFTSFFVAKKQEKTVEEENVTKVRNFMPFEVKADMKVAPVFRRTLTEQEKLLLDEKCNEGSTEMSDLYLSELKNKKIAVRKSAKTWPLEAKDCVIILDDENDDCSNIVKQNIVMEKQRPKLLQFVENQRPPYWGTWRKRSDSIKPRRPLTKDPQWFNYEVNSDDEWEEEEPGESLHGSDDEKDEENPEDNEYDVDNEFMVPHGYLSDEELRADDEDEDMSPETQKFKLKVLGEQFESERTAKTAKLKPKIIGCIWRGPENQFSPNVPQRIIDFMSAREAWVRQIPVILSSASESEPMTATECGTPTQQQAPSSLKKTRVPETMLPDLIRLVHGNVHGRKFLVKEFMAYLSETNKIGECRISMRSLWQKIGAISKWTPCPDEGAMHQKSCWYVSEEFRKQYLEEDLPLPNRWSYILSPKRKVDTSEGVEKLEKENKDKKSSSRSLITQFTKKITQEEMKKQLNVKPEQTVAESTPAPVKAPKRATLISVGRGEQFSKALKQNLLKSVVGSAKAESIDSGKGVDSNDDVIVVESSINNRVDDNESTEKRDKSDDRKEDSVVPVECESETENRQRSSESIE